MNTYMYMISWFLGYATSKDIGKHMEIENTAEIMINIYGKTILSKKVLSVDYSKGLDD